MPSWLPKPTSAPRMDLSEHSAHPGLRTSEPTDPYTLARSAHPASTVISSRHNRMISSNRASFSASLCSAETSRTLFLYQNLTSSADFTAYAAGLYNNDTAIVEQILQLYPDNPSLGR
jgi:hypothetical protein